MAAHDEHAQELGSGVAGIRVLAEADRADRHSRRARGESSKTSCAAETATALKLAEKIDMPWHHPEDPDCLPSEIPRRARRFLAFQEVRSHGHSAGS
jgi:hypothetical protein